MDRRKIGSIKEGLKPFINKLTEVGKPLCTSCITPVVGNDNSSPFTLEVQADWIDNMECLDAISYLFDILKEAQTSEEIMQSLFAIQVIGMDSEIKCRQVNYVVLEKQGCFV